MTNKLPEALRLADAIGGWHAPAHASIADCDKAAAMLRTQHALLERARDALGACTSEEGPTQHELSRSREILAALNQHLDQP